MENRESWVQFKSVAKSAAMLKGTNYLDLKFQDQGDNYLINSLLGYSRNDSDLYIDDLMAEHPQGEHYQHQLQLDGCDIQQLVCDVSSYICLRTASLGDIVGCIEQYNTIPKEKHRQLLTAIKKHKLTLKREHAKSKNPTQAQRPREEESTPVQIKLQQSQLSPFVYNDQSQETKKKKRNRMSAQNSRDRKKQYIRQIQNQNRELRRRLALDRSKKVGTASRDFVKLLLCLGIACYNNMQNEENSPVTIIAEEYTDEERERFCEDPSKATLANLRQQMRTLDHHQQQMIRQTMECLGESLEEYHSKSKDPLASSSPVSLCSTKSSF